MLFIRDLQDLGDIQIDRYSQGKFFKPHSDLIIIFYHMEQLKTFDAVLVHDTLKDLKAIIDVAKDKLILPNKVEIPLLQHKFQEVNKTQIRNDHLSNHEKKLLGNFLTSFQELFQPPD